MTAFFYPLEVMRLRTAQLASVNSSTFGRVRNNNTRVHQGWDLDAEPGTSCFSIADGIVLWTRSGGAYGEQLAIQFNRDGSGGNTESRDPLVAFYAHLTPGSISLSEGSTVRAGQFVASTGTSGNASHSAPHLHFEIRTKGDNAGRGLNNRLDPAEVLGYGLYQSGPDGSTMSIGGIDSSPNTCSLRSGRATPVVNAL